MATYNYTKHYTLLGSSSNATQSTPVFVGDFRFMSISVESSTGSASRYTVQISDADGFGTAIREGEWSTGTVLTSQGVQTVDPGIRWVRVQRDTISLSASSNATIRLAGNAG